MAGNQIPEQGKSALYWWGSTDPIQGGRFSSPGVIETLYDEYVADIRLFNNVLEEGVPWRGDGPLLTRDYTVVGD